MPPVIVIRLKAPESRGLTPLVGLVDDRTRNKNPIELYE